MSFFKVKVHLRITGGLGNQIFQYLYAMSIANETEGKLFVHTSFMNDFSIFRAGLRTSAKRKFSLHKLPFFDYEVTNVVSEKNFLTSMVFGQLRIFKFNYLRNLIFRFSNNLYLDGYFMTANEYLKISVLEGSICTTLQNNITSRGFGVCGIHLRAGDLLQQDHPKCSVNYFENSIKYFIENYQVNDFEIITENIEHAKLFFDELKNKYNILFVDTGSEIDDFRRLASYDYLIASNSTFSWWAGALGYSKKFICTPFIYTLNDKPVHSKEICLSHNGYFDIY
jgi:hypothetical protein